MRTIDFEKEANDSDEEMIEVEIAVSGETLPQAMSAVVGDDNQPYEVDVVVDFSMTPESVAISPAIPPPSSNQLPSNHGNELREPDEDQSALDDVEKMSDMSDNWAEDRFQKVTEAEKQVRASS